MLLLVGCGGQQPSTEPALYVSIPPLRTLVTEIVGDDFEVKVLVPAGASPETFEPTPRQFIELNRAELIFQVGLLDFEQTLLDKLQAQERIVNLSEGVDLLAGHCAHSHAAHHSACDCEAGHHPTATHTHGIDPHIWTSPKALRQMASNAWEAIARAYPDSVKYTENYALLQQKISELDRRTAEKIAQRALPYFLIYHPALSYYARDYGVEQVAIEDQGKEPSARRLSELIHQARKAGIRAIFYQSQYPASAVEIIASDIGAQCVQIDPLREDVIANIDHITDLICSK